MLLTPQEALLLEATGLERGTLLSPRGCGPLHTQSVSVLTGRTWSCLSLGPSVCLSGATLCVVAVGVSVQACVCVCSWLQPSSELARVDLCFPLPPTKFSALRMLLTAPDRAAAAWGSNFLVAQAPGTSLGGGTLQHDAPTGPGQSCTDGTRAHGRLR